MYLQEEYYNIHQIKDVPIIIHIKEGILLLRAGTSYILMTITWKESDSRPGKYYIDYLAPIHDGYNKGQYFTRISEESERVLEWDEYQSYLIHWCRNKEIVPIVDDREVVLAAWEIFVCSCDGFLVDWGTPDLMGLIHKSIDRFSSVECRFVEYQNCLLHITVEYPIILKVFKNIISPKISQNYCYWLGKLALTDLP